MVCPPWRARLFVKNYILGLWNDREPIGWFVGNGLDRSVPPCQKHDISGNRAPFGAILCAARGHMCGWVETHPYKSSGNGLFLQAEASNARPYNPRDNSNIIKMCAQGAHTIFFIYYLLSFICKNPCFPHRKTGVFLFFHFVHQRQPQRKRPRVFHRGNGDALQRRAGKKRLMARDDHVGEA